MQESNEEDHNNPLVYSIDNSILMQRDAHFAGSFPLMIEYYQKEGRGMLNEIELSRIEELYEIEQRDGVNLSAVMLSGAEMEKIASSRKFYKQLRDLFDADDAKKSIPLLIAELILAEAEDIEGAIQAVVAEKGTIVPALITVLRNEDLHDPFFPGYGQAPELAAQCLGLIADKRAIIALFEEIGAEDFFREEIVLQSLKAIGEPAKTFLLNVLHARPLNNDNERAALALGEFKDDQAVATTCLNMLKELDLKKYPFLGSYLVLVCEGLTDPLQRQELLEIAKQDGTPKTVREDIKIMSKEWL